MKKIGKFLVFTLPLILCASSLRYVNPENLPVEVPHGFRLLDENEAHKRSGGFFTGSFYFIGNHGQEIYSQPGIWWEQDKAEVLKLIKENFADAERRAADHDAKLLRKEVLEDGSNAWYVIYAEAPGGEKVLLAAETLAKSGSIVIIGNAYFDEKDDFTKAFTDLLRSYKISIEPVAGTDAAR